MPATQTKREQALDILRTFDTPPPTAEWTAACMRAGLWSADEDERLLFRQRQAQVRQWANQADVNGLPSAQIIAIRVERDEDGEVVDVDIAVQRELWTETTTLQWVRQRLKGIRDDAKKVAAMLAMARERWPDVDWHSEVAGIAKLFD